MRPWGGSAAASSRRSTTGLANALTKTSLTRSRYSLPPLPWPRRMRSPSVIDPPIPVPRRAGALAADHAGAHRVLGGAARAEERAVCRICDAAQHLAAAAAGRVEGQLDLDREAQGCIRLGELRAERQAGAGDDAQAAPVGVAGLEHLLHQPLRDEVALGAHRAAVLDLDGRPGLPHEAQ